MHPQRLLAAAMLLLSLTACEPSQQGNGRATAPQQTQLLDLSKADIIAGDLLFRRGESLLSRAVLHLDGAGHYSHVGIAVKREGRLWAAHAVPGEDATERLKIEPIERFFSPDKASEGAIVRYPLHSSQRALINARACAIADAQPLFDHRYNTEEHSKLYCTEYVWLVYQILGWDISSGQRAQIDYQAIKSSIILPSHLLQDERIKKITLQRAQPNDIRE